MFFGVIMVSNLITSGKYKYAPLVKKLLIYQFGAAMLGFMLSLSTTAIPGGKALDLCTSLVAIAFYLYIQYTGVWDVAAKDKISVDCKRMEADPLTGLKAALFANVPNFILGFVCIVFRLLSILTKLPWTDTVAAMSYGITRMWNGMYNGIFVILFPQKYSDAVSVLYMLLLFAVTIPSLIVCYVAYNQGICGQRILPEKKS